MGIKEAWELGQYRRRGNQNPQSPKDLVEFGISRAVAGDDNRGNLR